MTTPPSASVASTTSCPASRWRTRTRSSPAPPPTTHTSTRTNLAILDEWIAGRDDITYVKPADDTGTLRTGLHLVGPFLDRLGQAQHPSHSQSDLAPTPRHEAVSPLQVRDWALLAGLPAAGMEGTTA
ncbi:hypothetical protein AB0D42_25000 [Streptomyces sp. NPDC048304]|uniref:hypothetical protein n=1 Tax=Streptomyces sp. NPDC048304 TaxID=3154820 RepID=UPI0033F07FDC